MVQSLLGQGIGQGADDVFLTHQFTEGVRAPFARQYGVTHRPSPFGGFMATSPMGGSPGQPHSGARVHCCRCSLPDLTGFTMYRREGTNRGHHVETGAARGTRRRDAGL
ncbi:MAG: hypothetical protein AMXMBFR76_00060 [Pseudomonadota bacterium]